MANIRKNVLKHKPRRFDMSAPNFEPIHWTKYFESQRGYDVGENVFNVYRKGDAGPLLVALHGGGYSALTWSLFTEEIFKKITCQVLAMDLRGHGDTITSNDGDLSLETLALDVVQTVQAVCAGVDPFPSVILIGHSMGGAVAVEAARHMPSIVGVCVIDVVEGTALESLSSMQSILRSRPPSFKSIEHAIQWCFRSGQTHNAESARVSMPGQIRNKQTMKLAANEVGEAKSVGDANEASPQPPPPVNVGEEVMERSDVIREEDEEGAAGDSGDSGDRPPPHPGRTEFVHPISVATYEWRIDLSKTEPFWNGWFKGLSQKFLDVPSPKILLLANIQGLDTSLTIGQMQGKFQLQVLPKSGHAIHEDQPDRVADVIAGFLVKQRLAQAESEYIPSMPAC